MDTYTAKKESMMSANAVLMKDKVKFASVTQGDNEGTTNITLHDDNVTFIARKKDGERGLFVFSKGEDETEVAHGWRKDEKTGRFEIVVNGEEYALVCTNERKEENKVYKVSDGELGTLMGSLHRDIWKRAMLMSFRSADVPKLLIPLSLCLCSAYARMNK